MAAHEASKSLPIRRHCDRTSLSAACCSNLCELRCCAVAVGYENILLPQPVEIRIRRLLIEVSNLARLPGVRPTQLIPRTLARQNRDTTSELLDRISTLRKRRRTSVMPLHLEPVRVQPLASPEPLIQAHDPTPTITERHLLPLSVLHQPRLISTDSALSRRVHSVLPEIASRQTKKVRSPHHQMVNRVMEVLQIRRPKLAELRFRILGGHDRPE